MIPLPKIHETAAGAQTAIADWTRQCVDLAVKLGVGAFEIKGEALYYAPKDLTRVCLISQFTPSMPLPLDKHPNEALATHLAERALTLGNNQTDPKINLDLNRKLPRTREADGNGRPTHE